MTKRYRVGVDIGGTFTDLIVVNTETGAFAVGKSLTTPVDPSLVVETVLLETLRRAGVDPAEVQHLVHGTTHWSNNGGNCAPTRAGWARPRNLAIGAAGRGVFRR